MESLIIESCFIDKITSINNDLIDNIPFIKNLKIHETPDIRSNSKTLKEIINHYKSTPLESLSISPYFSSVNRDEIETLLKMGTQVNLTVFPQSNFWNENESFNDLPVYIKTDSLDMYFYYKIFRKQFIFAPIMFLMYPFASVVGQFIHFISAFIIASIFLPLEDLLPARFHLPIHPDHYRHSMLIEKCDENITTDKMSTQCYRIFIGIFLIFFLISLYSMVASIFSKSWLPWILYTTLTLINVFMYHLYIDYTKKVVK